jgi:hypothetical protein
LAPVGCEIIWREFLGCKAPGIVCVKGCDDARGPVCMRVCMYVCVYVSVFVHVCVCVYMCVHLCMYVCEFLGSKAPGLVCVEL